MEVADKSVGIDLDHGTSLDVSAQTRRKP